MVTIFGFLYVQCTLCHLANTTEPSMCGAMRPYAKSLWPLVFRGGKIAELNLRLRMADIVGAKKNRSKHLGM